jgi:ABC-type branched-subunit amino acid transport system substrate-binding protein
MQKELSGILKLEGIKFQDITGRTKRIYSLYKKLERYDGDISKIYDLHALRIITKSTADCYAALGIIHKHFNPVPGRVKDFIAQYKAKFNVVPDGLAAMGYDAVLVLTDAMTKAPTLTTKDIRDTLAKTQNFAGVTGVLSLNEKRDAVKSAVVLKVENGSFKYQTTVNPQ